MAEPQHAWNAARLIPTSGINGADEQERRATSALLAVMSTVKEFGRAIIGPLGAPVGAVECFIEVPFDLNGKRIFPDGLIRAKRGAKSWTALVEVKTGVNELKREQLENYLDVAREHGFDALLTISNELPAALGTHPTEVDGRKLRSVKLHHMSWAEVLSHAVLQKEFRGVADPEQAWILGELIRYLEHPKSGALEFNDMGPNWVSVRDAVTARTLRKSDKGAAEVAARFDALIRFSALKLGQRLGTEVTQVLTRSQLADPASRTAALAERLVTDGVLHAEIAIPNAVSPLAVHADLRSGQLTCSFTLAAPAEGRATTRVNWLVRQLKDAPDTLRIEAFAARQRASTAELLRVVREDASRMISDPTKELKSFTVAQMHPLGAKRGVGRGAFIDSVLDGVTTSYEVIGQQLKAWSATPPRLRSEDEVEVEPRVDLALRSAALSSQDEESGGTSTAIHA